MSRNTVPDYIAYLEASGLFNALREPGHSDNLLARSEKLFLGTRQLFRPTASKISDFEIDDITLDFEGLFRNSDGFYRMEDVIGRFDDTIAEFERLAENN